MIPERVRSSWGENNWVGSHSNSLLFPWALNFGRQEWRGPPSRLSHYLRPHNVWIENWDSGSVKLTVSQGLTIGGRDRDLLFPSPPPGSWLSWLLPSSWGPESPPGAEPQQPLAPIIPVSKHQNPQVTTSVSPTSGVRES